MRVKNFDINVILYNIKHKYTARLLTIREHLSITLIESEFLTYFNKLISICVRFKESNGKNIVNDEKNRL